MHGALCEMLRYLRLITLDTVLDGSEANVIFSHRHSPNLSESVQRGLDHSPAVVFYDGASVLMQAELAGGGWEELSGETICLLADSTSEIDFAGENQRRNLGLDLMPLATIADMRAAFDDGRCNVLVLERSLLEIIRQSSANPETLAVWAQPFGLAPVSPFYAYGDEQFAWIVDWTLWGLIEAEKQGISSRNIGDFLPREDENSDVYQRRVGQTVALLFDSEDGLGITLGLAPDFMAAVIQQVGNYGEIYDRNLGPSSNLPIERSLNRLVYDGGILDAGRWR
jgi:general L-amino acid transport system substrate-binding protein